MVFICGSNIFRPIYQTYSESAIFGFVHALILACAFVFDVACRDLLLQLCEHSRGGSADSIVSIINIGVDVDVDDYVVGDAYGGVCDVVVGVWH